jgi:hypothetical protein
MAYPNRHCNIGKTGIDAKVLIGKSQGSIVQDEVGEGDILDEIIDFAIGPHFC